MVQTELSDEILIKNIHAGGLRMVNVNEFIISLKVTWLKRLITFFDNDS